MSKNKILDIGTSLINFLKNFGKFFCYHLKIKILKKYGQDKLPPCEQLSLPTSSRCRKINKTQQSKQLETFFKSITQKMMQRNP